MSKSYILTDCWCLTAGPGSSEETVDAIQSPMGSATTWALLHEIHLLHRHLHNWGACFHVPSWLQQRTLEWQTNRRLWASGSQDGRDIRINIWRERQYWERRDSVKLETGATLSERSQTPPSQHLRVDTRTFKACVLAKPILLKYYPRLCLYSLQLCFCELKRKGNEKIQTWDTFFKMSY